MSERRALKTALYGMLIALALLLGYVETMLPSLGLPGVKLGLGNLVTMTGLYTVGITGTVLVSAVRILVTGFTFGNLFSMLYSFGGWLVSILVMALCRKGNWFSPVGISILGGAAHNLGQLTVAAFVVKQVGVFSYFPVLLVSGTAAGMAIGIVGGLIVERIGPYIKKIQ